MEKRSTFNNSALKFILFLIVLAVCWYLGRVFKFDISDFRDFLSKYPLALSGAIFVVLYVAVTTFVWFGPKDVFRVSSAILFGPYISTVFIWISEMASALIMFHTSRILGRSYVQQKLGVGPEKLDKIKDNASFFGAVLWRINPLVPFRLMDLGYGLTSISFPKYLAAIIIVSFFRILWLQFILAGVGVSIIEDTSAVFDYFMAHPQILRLSAVYFFAVIFITIISSIARFVRRKKQI